MRSFLFGCLFSVLFVAGAGFLALWLGFYPVNADTDPAWAEKKLAKMAVDAYVSRQASKLENPIAVSPEALMDGMKSFKSNCAGCHGFSPQKDSTFADSMYPKAPQFGHKGLHDEVEEIFWITKHGIRMSGMPAFTKMLSDKEMWSISMFLANFDKLPRDVKTKWESAE